MNAEHVAYTFLTNTVHIPPRTRKWNEISVPCARGNTAFFVLLGKPEPLPKGNHPLLGTSNVVADAQIPLAVTGPWIDSNSYFTDVIDVLLEEAGRLIEHLRIRVQEPLLRLRSIQDGSFTGVVSVRRSSFSEGAPRVVDPEGNPQALCIDLALDEPIRGCRPGLGQPTTRNCQSVRVGVVGRHWIIHAWHCLQRFH